MRRVLLVVLLVLGFSGISHALIGDFDDNGKRNDVDLSIFVVYLTLHRANPEIFPYNEEYDMDGDGDLDHADGWWLSYLCGYSPAQLQNWHTVFNGQFQFDINNSGGPTDMDDIDEMTTVFVNAKIPPGMPPLYYPEMDYNYDGKNDGHDISIFVAKNNNTETDQTIGDIDLDGDYETDDIVDVYAAGKWNQATKKYSEGDFNADGVFDHKDNEFAIEKSSQPE